jgi:hypothetical protein
MVEAAGVESDSPLENTQLTDLGIASIGTNSMSSKSAVRSLYSHLPKIPEHQTPPSDGPRSTKGSLKFVRSISQMPLADEFKPNTARAVQFHAIYPS